MTGPPAGPADPSAAWAYTVARARDVEAQTAMLWTVGATGVWVRASDVVAYFDERVHLDSTGGPLIGGGTWEEVAPTDWLAEWRASVEPITAGRFDVVPTWLADTHETALDRLRILVDPGQAFGSGHHDTTAGCLEELGRDGVVGPDSRVLDVGTGTGVLAIAAALLGAGQVLGVDVDPVAISVARSNAAVNEVTIETSVGSIGDTDGQWDVVCANLLTHTVVNLARPLVAALAPAGTLIASGIGWERRDEALAALRDAGLVEMATRQRGEWAIITGHPEDPS